MTIIGRDGGFIPKQINGCALWLRADLGVTLVNSAVTAWADQSGQGNNVVAGNAPSYIAQDPGYNGKPTLSFVGASSQSLAGTFKTVPQPFTEYLVCESSSGAGVQVPLGCTNSCEILWSGTVWEIADSGAVPSTNANRAIQCHAGVFNGASSKYYINRSAAVAVSGNPGTDSFNNNIVVGSSGGANFLNGKIAEIIVFSGAHTPAQISFVFQYFASRYNPGVWL